jgi:hypothetical protein
MASKVFLFKYTSVADDPGPKAISLGWLIGRGGGGRGGVEDAVAKAVAGMLESWAIADENIHDHKTTDVVATNTRRVFIRRRKGCPPYYCGFSGALGMGADGRRAAGRGGDWSNSLAGLRW